MGVWQTQVAYCESIASKLEGGGGAGQDRRAGM